MSWSIAHLVSHTERWAKAVVAPMFTPVLSFPAMGHDLDTVLDGADELAEREAEEEVWEPLEYDDDPMVSDSYLRYNDPGSGAIDGGAPQQVTLTGREYERYLEGALNEPPRSQCLGCGDADTEGHKCGRDQTDLDEITFGPVELRCPKANCGILLTTTWDASSRRCPGCGSWLEINTFVPAEWLGNPTPGMADMVAQLAQLTYFVEDIRNIVVNLAPVASAGVGASPAEERNVPAFPSVGRPKTADVNAAEPSPVAMQRRLGDEGPMGDSDIPPSPPMGHLTLQAIAQIIRDHRLWRNTDGSGGCECLAWTSEYPITDHPEHLAEHIVAAVAGDPFPQYRAGQQ